MNNLPPGLVESLDQLAMELRGYETAKLTPDGHWELVATYQPTERARLQALRDAASLEHSANHTYDKATKSWVRRAGARAVYRVRPVISLDIGFAAKPEPEKLVLEADVSDALLAPGELPTLGDSVENSSESVIIKPEDAELAGTGFFVGKDKPEVPFNYDQLAAGIDIPDPWGKG